MRFVINDIFNGKKTQISEILSRQPVQPEPDCHPNNKAKHAAPYLDAYCSQPRTGINPRGKGQEWCWWQVDDRQCADIFLCPYGKPGDKYDIEEHHALVPTSARTRGTGAGKEKDSGRVAIEIVDTAIERLQNTSDADAMAEGVAELPLQEGEPGAWWTADVTAGSPLHGRTPLAAYRLYWEKIHGVGSWDANPWIWRVKFRCVTP